MRLWVIFQDNVTPNNSIMLRNSWRGYTDVKNHWLIHKEIVGFRLFIIDLYFCSLWLWRSQKIFKFVDGKNIVFTDGKKIKNGGILYVQRKEYSTKAYILYIFCFISVKQLWCCANQLCESALRISCANQSAVRMIT